MLKSIAPTREGAATEGTSQSIFDFRAAAGAGGRAATGGPWEGPGPTWPRWAHQVNPAVSSTAAAAAAPAAAHISHRRGARADQARPG